jgi:hypothetical protein
VEAASARAAELADLRRRAYGPDADIQADPHALARLAELEREFSPVTRADPDAPAGADGSPSAADEDAATPPPATDHGRGARRGGVARVIAFVASIVAALALGALAVDQLTQPRPVARLPALAEPPRGTSLPALSRELLQLFDGREPVFVSHGEYGALDLWSTEDARGQRCLAVSVGGDVPGFDCTVPTIDTIVNIRSQNSWMPENPEGGPIPNGSALRFVLRDDVVEVYVGRVLPPRPPSDEGG